MAKKKLIPTNRHDGIEPEEIDDSVDAGDSQSSAESENDLFAAEDECEKAATFDSISVNRVSCEKESSSTIKPLVHTSDSMPINSIAHTNNPMPINSTVHSISQTNLGNNRLIDALSSPSDQDSILGRQPFDLTHSSVQVRMSCFAF